MKLVLHIDSLVLRGVPVAERDAVVASLQASLERELAAPGIAEGLAAGGHRDRVRARFAPAPSPQALGRDAAQHIIAGARP